MKVKDLPKESRNCLKCGLVLLWRSVKGFCLWFCPVCKATGCAHPPEEKCAHPIASLRCSGGNALFKPLKLSEQKAIELYFRARM